jgi:hypothetical protein
MISLFWIISAFIAGVIVRHYLEFFIVKITDKANRERRYPEVK